MSNDLDIISKLQTRILNSSTQLQKGDRFQVRFLGLPDNLSDFLSRQVKNVAPPSISFDTVGHSNRRTRFSDVGKIEKEPLTVNILNDENGIAESIILAQIFRQKGEDIVGLGGIHTKFDLRVEYMDVRGEVVRYETYKQCFIRSYSRADLEVTADVPVMNTLSLEYEELEYSIEGKSYLLVE